MILFARGAVARHGHTGGAGLPQVAEDHGDDVDRGAQVVGNAGGIAVIDGALAVPALEDRFGGQAQLVEGILGEFHFGMPVKNRFEFFHNTLEGFGRQLRVVFHLAPAAGLLQNIFEKVVLNFHDDAAEHLNQPAVGIENKPFVAGQGDHALDCFVVQPDIQHRIHHTGHGEFGAAATGHQQGAGGVAERLAAGGLHGRQGAQQLIPHAVRKLVAGREIGIAGLGGDGEARGNGNADAGHLGEIGALAPQQRPHILPVAAGLGLNFFHFVKTINPFCHNRPPSIELVYILPQGAAYQPYRWRVF